MTEEMVTGSGKGRLLVQEILAIKLFRANQTARKLEEEYT